MVFTIRENFHQVGSISFKYNFYTNVEHKSAIINHADRHNCVIDWEGATVVDKETNRCAHWIKEAIWIRKTKPTMNREEGGYRRVGQSARYAI